MNIENFNAWIKALRSGKYEQTTGSLYAAVEDKDGSLVHDATGDTIMGYCCLGVGCVIAPMSRDYWAVEDLAPREFVEWLGLAVCDCDACTRSSAGSFDISLPAVATDPTKRFTLRGRHPDTAATMNDEYRSFDEIADWLEANRDQLLAVPS
jgi:hypothetical protein